LRHKGTIFFLIIVYLMLFFFFQAGFCLSSHGAMFLLPVAMEVRGDILHSLIHHHFGH